jgi:hypothetical protein
MCRQSWHVAALALVCTATTCVRTQSIRQTFLPSPSVECLRSALRASPEVREVGREEVVGQWASFGVVLRDSTGSHHARIVRDQRRAGYANMTVTVHRSTRPTADEEHVATRLAIGVLDSIRAVCARSKSP